MRVIMLLCCICIFSGCTTQRDYPPEPPPDYADAYASLQWFFEKGVPLYYHGVAINDIYGLYKKATGHMDDLSISDGTGFTRFTITRYARSGTMQMVGTRYASDIQDTVLEYWVIEVYFHSWLNNLFIITQADDMQSRRKILLEETQYFSAAVMGNRTIKFPEDNLRAVYSLQAYCRPWAFEHSPLKNYTVIYKGGNPSQLRKWNFFQRADW